MESVSVRNISKQFHRGERCDSLYSLIARRLARSMEYQRRREAAAFWALRGISLWVRAGECVGVIGHNGAGKSTLLKLLAGLMRPDEGSIEVRGRVSALIEVGAGFHPLLTGRENVYLNGSILGMSREETRRKFDAIVEFAGVGEHIDAPVKHYSSGMHARLGFAIAVHAEPDVLLVDEVLSVGDQQFRSRCIERMEAFLRNGVAIIFVSHDLDTVQRFCHRTLVLSEGREKFSGASAEAIARYHRSYAQTVLLSDANGRPLADLLNLRLFESSKEGRAIDEFRSMVDVPAPVEAGHPAGGVAPAISRCHTPRGAVLPGESVTLAYDVEFKTDVENPSFGLSITRISDRLTVYETSSARQGVVFDSVQAGEKRHVRCSFEMNVSAGDYAIGLHVRERDSLQYLIEEVEAIRVSVIGECETSGPVHAAIAHSFGATDFSSDVRTSRPVEAVPT